MAVSYHQSGCSDELNHPLQVVDVSPEFGVDRDPCCRSRLPDAFHPGADRIILLLLLLLLLIIIIIIIIVIVIIMLYYYYYCIDRVKIAECGLVFVPQHRVIQ